jgi:hypothetical protein
LSVTGESRSALQEAREFLLGLLVSGVPVQVTEVRKAAEAEGMSWSTIKRAKKELEIEARKTGMASGWAWQLPTDPKEPIDPASKAAPHTPEPLRQNRFNTSIPYSSDPVHGSKETSKEHGPLRAAQSNEQLQLPGSAAQDTSTTTARDRQDGIFLARLDAGDDHTTAAIAAGFDPRRIPVRLAEHAPDILGESPEFYEKLERENRVPPGTAALARNHTQGDQA